MTKKKTNNVNEKEHIDLPQDITKCGFLKRFPYKLEQEQLEYIKAIWNPKNTGVFVNAKAGASKTSIAIGMGLLMTREFQMYDKMYYIINPATEVDSIGFLPGTAEAKAAEFMTPLYQGITSWGYDPQQIIISESNMDAVKNGTAFVEAIPETFLRGATLDNAYIIIDEFENFDMRRAKKTLTRVGKNCKVVVLGCSTQCDLKYVGDSALPKYLNAANNCDFIEEVKLTKNYRSEYSNWADGVN